MIHQHPAQPESTTFAPQTIRFIPSREPCRRRTERYYQPSVHARIPRELLLLLNGLAGIAWFILTILQMVSAKQSVPSGSEYDIAIHEFRVGLSVAMQLPSILCAFVAVVLTWVAWLTRRNSFALASGLLFGAALLTGFGRPLGYIPFMLLSLTAYTRGILKERI